ncbi:MAG: biopolymer transporter ExbD [Phycisphaeraceae bacterium]|nr:biopolymer transporter ExbD [Phycisphaeraceae bacterium]
MSFTAPTRNRTGPTLPLSGLVDILFLLIIFFMTTSVFKEQERFVDVSLPATEAGDNQTARRAPVLITVTEEGGLFIGQTEHTLATLRETLGHLAENYPDETVVIRGDRQSRLGLSVQVMDAAYGAGLRNVMIATHRQVSGEAESAP